VGKSLWGSTSGPKHFCDLAERKNASLFSQNIPHRKEKKTKLIPLRQSRLLSVQSSPVVRRPGEVREKSEEGEAGGKKSQGKKLFQGRGRCSAARTKEQGTICRT